MAEEMEEDFEEGRKIHLMWKRGSRLTPWGQNKIIIIIIIIKKSW